jgi:hypothetical protein
LPVGSGIPGLHTIEQLQKIISRQEANSFAGAKRRPQSLIDDAVISIRQMLEGFLTSFPRKSISGIPSQAIYDLRSKWQKSSYEVILR